MPAAPASPHPSATATAPCRHCSGTGREPTAPLHVAFSRSGELRGRQQELAAESGVSAPMISRIFNGDVTPGPLHLIKLAAALRTTVDRILHMPAVWRKINEQP